MKTYNNDVQACNLKLSEKKSFNAFCDKIKIKNFTISTINDKTYYIK
jgi:hypothetical protein